MSILTVFTLTLFMLGESLRMPAAALLVIPLVWLPLHMGRIGKKIFAAVLLPCAVFTGAVAIYRFARVLNGTLMRNIPVWVGIVVLLSVSVYLASGGADGIRKWTAFALPFTAGFVLISVLLLAGKLQHTVFTLPPLDSPIVVACEGIALLGILPAIGDKAKPIQAYLAAFAVASAIWATVWGLCCLTLGAQLIQMARVPFYTALRITKGGEIVSRVEAFLIPVLLFLTVHKSGVCLHEARFAVNALVEKAPFSLSRKGA